METRDKTHAHASVAKPAVKKRINDAKEGVLTTGLPAPRTSSKVHRGEWIGKMRSTP